MANQYTAPGAKTYDPAMADVICARLCDGETLTSICRDLGLRPSTVYKWTQSQSDFAERFVRARDFGDIVLEDSAIDLSDDSLTQTDTVETESDDRFSSTRKRFDNVARSRLMAETRLKVVARRKGAKITNEIKFRKKSDEEAAAEMSTDALLEIARMKVEAEE